MQAHLIQKEHREFQKERRTISPGPAGYVVPGDPSFQRAEYQKPLSGQQSFLDHKRQGAFSKEARASFYSGNDKRYDDYQHKSMYYIKEGPGPAGLNLRDGKDPRASFHPKKISSTKTGFAQEKREVGLPSANFKNPAPNAYSQHSSLVEVKQQKSNLVFNKLPNNYDCIRYASGMEEHTIKGLI